ncbi:MAG: hypothetical protein IJR69_11555 [Bacteroidaceae bacterium]|nr:hypothetical protein [Bacteroidaceae bacterium]
MNKLKTISSYYRVRTSTIFTIVLFVISSFLSCHHGTSGLPEGKAFWGDSATAFIAKNPQNGYRVSIIKNKDLTLAHFERGDSISVYCTLDWLPSCLSEYENKTGVFDVDIDIPVVKVDTLGGSKTPKSDMFFMDINFDGQEEFIQGYESNGWVGYKCYDIVNGRANVLYPIEAEPYCSISYGIYPMQAGYTVFDYHKREIFIHHGSGCCAFRNIWAKYFEGDSLGNPPSVKVVREEYHQYSSDIETIETSELKDNVMQVTSKTKRKY